MIFSRFFHRRRRDRDLAKEIAAHIREERAENIARGLTPEEADLRARIKFGSARRVHEDLWQQNSVAPFENLTRDLRYTIRTLARTPGFTLTAILVMALGIGATAALFTVVKAVLLNPLPYPNSSRLVSLYESDTVSNTPTPWDPVAAASSMSGSAPPTKPRRWRSPRPGRATTSPPATASCRNPSAPRRSPGTSSAFSASHPRSAATSLPPTTSHPHPPLPSSPTLSGNAASPPIPASSAKPSILTPPPTPSSASCPHLLPGTSTRKPSFGPPPAMNLRS